MKKILTVFGTRPEAIKLGPVIHELKKYPEIETRICVTAQHREMLDQVLNLFELRPDIDLNLMRPDQSLAAITAEVVSEMEYVLEAEKPDVVVIQGDTTTVWLLPWLRFIKKLQLPMWKQD